MLQKTLRRVAHIRTPEQGANGGIVHLGCNDRALGLVAGDLLLRVVQHGAGVAAVRHLHNSIQDDAAAPCTCQSAQHAARRKQ